MRETIEALDRDPESADFSQENPIQLAALLKKFFIDLPDPLLTHRLHGLLIATQCEPSSHTFTKRLTQLQLSRMMKSEAGYYILFQSCYLKVTGIPWKSSSYF